MLWFYGIRRQDHEEEGTHPARDVGRLRSGRSRPFVYFPSSYKSLFHSSNYSFLGWNKYFLGISQRKDYTALTKFLLPKYEYVVLVRLSKLQMELYDKYLQRLSADGSDITGGPIRGSRIFTDYQNLMKIWTHPWVLKLDEIRQENRVRMKFWSDSHCFFLNILEVTCFYMSNPQSIYYVQKQCAEYKLCLIWLVLIPFPIPTALNDVILWGCMKEHKSVRP